MPEHVLYTSDYVTITASTARFGSTSYQIANVSSVSVTMVTKFNQLAVGLIILGVIVAGVAVSVNAGPLADIWPVMLLAVGLVIVGLVVQRIWPVREFTLFMKTCGGELQTLTSVDRPHILGVREAVETAFAMRRGVSSAAEAQVAPPGD